MFTVKIPNTENISGLKDMIKEKCGLSIRAAELSLLRVTLTMNSPDELVTEMQKLRLEGTPALLPWKGLAEVFNAVQSDHLHIVVKHPSAFIWFMVVISLSNLGYCTSVFDYLKICRHVPVHFTQSPRMILTVGAVALILDMHLHHTFSLAARREDVAKAARKRKSPSTGAKNSTLLDTQKVGRVDAVYNGRPIRLSAPDISIYHPVFASFRQKIAGTIDKASFTKEELTETHNFIISSLEFYNNEAERLTRINPPLRYLVDRDVLCTVEIPYGDTIFKPDGHIRCDCQKFPDRDVVALLFTEGKNGIGEGSSDPIHQSQCDYVAYYSAEKVYLFFPFLSAGTNCLIASAYSGCVLLSCLSSWNCRSIHDHLWCHLHRSLHFATPNRLYLFGRNPASRRAAMQDRQCPEGSQVLHSGAGEILHGTLPSSALSFG